MKEKLKNVKGITLVALIITIIVLLILAVVSINSIKSNNILKHAKDAKEDYSKAEEKEKVTLAVHEAVLDGKGTINKDGVKSGMNSQFPNGWEEVSSSDADTMIVKITASGNQYKITLSSGKVELVSGGSGTSDPTKEEVTWVQSGETGARSKTIVTGNNGKYNLEVGQTVTNFNAGNFEWKVLGVENGKLLLTTATNITDNYTIDGKTAEWSSTSNSYEDAEAGLTTYCQKNVSIADTNAESIRSINVEDINRVTGYSPTNQGDGSTYSSKTKVNSGEYTIMYNDTAIYKDGKFTLNGNEFNTSFYLPTSNTSTNDEINLTASDYNYSLNSLMPYRSSSSNVGLSNTSNAYKMLNDNIGSGYWLANSYTSIAAGWVMFGMRTYANLGSANYVYGFYMWNSNNVDDYYDRTFGVRAVVTMDKYFIPEV